MKREVEEYSARRKSLNTHHVLLGLGARFANHVIVIQKRKHQTRLFANCNGRTERKV